MEIKNDRRLGLIVAPTSYFFTLIQTLFGYHLACKISSRSDFICVADFIESGYAFLPALRIKIPKLTKNDFNNLKLLTIFRIKAQKTIIHNP